MLDTLHVTHENGITRVVIDNPPINLLDAALIIDLDSFITQTAQDHSTQVVIFESAHPEFFIAHGDMAFIVDPEAAAAGELVAGDNTLNPMLRLFERLRALPQITIGKLTGLARGGGSELLLALDMRFAATETAGIAQNEAPLGIIPGGGGTVHLPHLIGRARALEVILGARLLDATTAETYGLINRAIPADQLDAFVDVLAHRIATLAPGVLRGVTHVTDTALDHDANAALRVEDNVMFGLFSQPAASTLTHAALAAGAQTPEGERDLEALMDQLTPETYR